MQFRRLHDQWNRPGSDNELDRRRVNERRNRIETDAVTNETASMLTVPKFPFPKLFTALIESSFRHVTERVIKRNQSLESRSAPGNKELLKTKLFLNYFWFCLSSPKNRSGHPMEYTQTFRPLPAICYGDLWISWTCSVVYAIGAIRLALGYILCFNILQISSKVTSPHKKKGIEVSALNPCKSFAAKCFNFVFSDINTHAGFGFYCKNEYIDCVMTTLALGSVNMCAAHRVTRYYAVPAITLCVFACSRFIVQRRTLYFL